MFWGKWIPLEYIFGLTRWLSGKESATNAGDAGDVDSIPGSKRSSGVGNDNPLQDSCLENLMDRGAWWATWGHRVRHDSVSTIQQQDTFLIWRYGIASIK